MENAQITIVGTGAWGTALAVSLHNAGKNVCLWGRRPEHVELLCSTRSSPYLPNIKLPPKLMITDHFSEILNSDVLLWTAPVQQSRQLLEVVKQYIPAQIPVIVCSKGLEIESQQSLTGVFTKIIKNPIGVLSGPNFADEVAKGLPTAATLAFADLSVAKKLSCVLRHPAYRVYAHNDVAGVDLSGALKNVIAIAAGIVMGKQLGQNCLATLITRANAEISRLVCALGGHKETSQTLAGIGDLILTCTSSKSRNASLGIALALGQSLEDVLKNRKSVTEGVPTCKVAHDLSKFHKVHAPIISAIFEILYSGKSIDDVLHSVLSHQQDQELE